MFRISTVKHYFVDSRIPCVLPYMRWSTSHPHGRCSEAHSTRVWVLWHPSRWSTLALATSTMATVAFQQLREALLLYDTEPVHIPQCTRRRPRWVGYLKDIHTIPLELLFQARHNLSLLYHCRSIC